ncbi:ABC transporter substrate-binding protein [Natronospirillum operosum]|uniref:ABC transporter substrate-binding protein n=1 Tax=Natronospirillum operosum TaxID=2759953 RepID=A0A4Z0WDY0_9GAMM|nr:ABC transporter substrate-binding protein [Natronospirillum operosum]TGG93366.1 ABC transporter substrate-binding protein [Natronospirillum operosum]
MKQSIKLGLGLAMAATMTVAQANEVRVGMITTLSGGGAHLGVDVRDGFMLAIEQSGNSDVNVIIRDDAQRPDLANSLASEMMDRENVHVMTGLIWSNLAMAVVPSVTRQGMFYLSPNAGPSDLAGRMCHENYFNVAWQNDALHEAMGQYVRDQGYENPFILAPNYPAGTDALSGFKRYYDGELANEIYTQLGQEDYAAEISQIRASGADSVFYFLPGGMGISFMNQYANSGTDIPVFGPAFSFDEVIVGALGEAAEGVINTSQWAHDLDNDTNRAFVEAFRAEHGRTPTLYASQGYDTAKLLLSALEVAHPEDDPDAFREALRAADFASTRGEFRFASNQHPIQDIYVREIVANGDGGFTNQLIGVAMEDHQDVYGADCGL